MKDKILLDWKHWLGWFLTTGCLVGIFYLLPLAIMTSIPAIIGITMLVIVITIIN